MTNRSTALHPQRTRPRVPDQASSAVTTPLSGSTVATRTDLDTPCPPTGATALLESVAAITHMRDSDALDRSVVLSLAELTLADRVQLHRHTSFMGHTPASVVQCRRRADQPLTVSVENAHAEPAPEVYQDRQPSMQALPDGRQRLRVPVFHESRLLATLLIDNAHDMANAQQLVAGFARIYANYIALLNESERDKLTGLYNRRTFERHLQRRLDTSRAETTATDQREQVWVAIVDIDHFKRVNDTFGHLYGDEVILLIAQRMRHTFGERANLFRFGGEEFVILFNAPDEHEAGQLLEQFRCKVADRPFPQVGAVSVSMGFCHITRHDFPEAALDRADQALYYAKSHGRNQLHGYEGLIRCGQLKVVSAGSIDLF